MHVLKTTTLLKRGSNTGVFLWTLRNFLEHLFSIEHLQWLLLTVSDFQSVTLLKERLGQRCFSVNFAKFLRTSFHRISPDDCFLCYLWILRSFSEHIFHRAPRGNYSFHRQDVEFQLADTVKLFHRGVHLIKIPENYLWRS